MSLIETEDVYPLNWLLNARAPLHPPVPTTLVPVTAT
jgi:hypothetical protein